MGMFVRAGQNNFVKVSKVRNEEISITEQNRIAEQKGNGDDVTYLFFSLCLKIAKRKGYFDLFCFLFVFVI